MNQVEPMTQKRRDKHRKPVEERVDATQETKAKLRYDVCARMEIEGKLSHFHMDAAAEIRGVWEGMTRSIFPGISDTPRQAHSRSRGIDPLCRLTTSEEIAHRTRYSPWVKEMGAEMVPKTLCSMLEMVLDIVVDNRRLGDVERGLGLKVGGEAARHLRSALHRYAVIGGWIDT